MKEKQKKTVSTYPTIKKRANRLRKYLPVAILGEADAVNIEEINPGVQMATQRADDEFLIICRHYPGSYFFIGKVLLVTTLFIYVIIFKDASSKELIYPLILVLIGALCVLYGYTKPKGKIILDRMNGLFTYPGHMMDPPITIPFKDAVVDIGSQGWPPSLSLNAYHRNGHTASALSHYKPIQTWNLYVWYMDKNRPLPPGSAFDAYRQKDYERRKAEGFPPPLYSSTIPTPEYPFNPSDKLEHPNKYY